MHNPLRPSATRRALNDEPFVRLFGTGVMRSIRGIEDSFKGPAVPMSATGGGQTSFPRSMTSCPLRVAAKLEGDPYSGATNVALRDSGVIKDAADRRRQAMHRRQPGDQDAKRLLEAVAQIYSSQGFRPTAPYAPRGTGFVIATGERACLSDASENGTAPHGRFQAVLASVVALGEISPPMDRKNKRRGKMVLYLNRLPCVHFDLPLWFGGWHQRWLDSLSQWLEHQAEAVEEAHLVE